MADPGTTKYDVLFGPTPDQIKSAARSTAQAQNLQKAQLKPLEAVQFQAYEGNRIFGDALKNLMGAGDSPDVQKAQKMQLLKAAVEQEAQTKNINLSTHPEEYFKILTDKSIGMGMSDVAMNALPMINNLRQLRISEAEAAAKAAAAAAQKPVKTPKRTAEDRKVTSVLASNWLQQFGQIDPATGQEAAWNMSNPEKITNYATLATDLDAAVQTAWAEAGGTEDRNQLMHTMMPMFMARISRSANGDPTSTNPMATWRDNPTYYATKDQVRSDYNSGVLDKAEALRILREGFGAK